MGGLWGSFANVCIYRIPLDRGVALGRSYCTKCNKQIAWYDNIPIFSYLLIQGKCRKCKKKISFQYPLVELLNILAFITIYFFYGVTITTVLLITLALTFLIIFFIDLEHFIIPNSLTFPMMILGLAKSFDPNLNSLFPNYINSIIGGFFGYGIIWMIIFFYKVFRNKEGMGLGDAKLLAVIGFWFGWISVPFILFSSSVVALLSVMPSLLNKSKRLSSEIPFGPFIIIGCILYIIFIEQYKNLILG